MPYLFTFREILNLAKEFGRSLPGKHLIPRYFNIDRYARQKYGLISMCILPFDTNTKEVLKCSLLGLIGFSAKDHRNNSVTLTIVLMSLFVITDQSRGTFIISVKKKIKSFSVEEDISWIFRVSSLTEWNFDSSCVKIRQIAKTE